MSIQSHPDGRRSVRSEVEVPGTPEQVWKAIASGPGITAWFVPTTLEPRVGGSLTSDFGGGMVSTATITAYEPPFRLAAESPGWTPGMPAVATEWTVEAKSGGTCIVRVVHSLFASTDEWDGQIEGTESGWPAFFRVLRRYLERFPGQPCAQVHAVAMTGDAPQAAWSALTRALGIEKPAAKARFRREIAPGCTLAGTIVRIDAQGAGSSAFAHLEEPLQGSLVAGAFPCGGVMVSLQAYLYGPDSAAVAERTRPRAAEWLGALFPAPASPPA